MSNSTYQPNSSTESWSITSKVDQTQYEIVISKPLQPPPPTGYPVIYVLDGNAFFQTVQDAVRLQARKSEKTGVSPAIVVGVGYATDQDFDTANRLYHFTPTSRRSIDAGKSGGAKNFLAFIEEELKPQIEKTFSINVLHQTLFGHSLGGLFALYTLFIKATAFQYYIAISPSIWWDNRYILTRVEPFMTNLHKQKNRLNLFLAVGSRETDFMISDSSELFHTLFPATSSNLNVTYYKADEENHISMVPSVVSRVLRFISNS